MIVLGIETSCDETAAALVEDGRRVLSSVVRSQTDLHGPYGGVVPELASRMHVEALSPVFREALRKANLNPKDINAVAATRGPGLVGSLLTGFSFAKALAFSLEIPFIGVNHLYGHIHSVFLAPPPHPGYPFIALLVSGGHTALYRVMSPVKMELLGQTRDDAAGEAFDKAAKILGLSYPGGIAIDRLAKSGDPKRIRFPRAFLDKDGFDFSFSGVKSAVLRHVETHPEALSDDLAHVAASFQEAVCEVLAKKAVAACKKYGLGHLVVAGGVAANSRLRAKVRETSKEAGIEVFIPPPELCGDNAAMIAAAGFHFLEESGPTPLLSDVFSRVEKAVKC